jgi:hypothetical protein
MFFKFFSEGLMKRLSPTTGRICAVSEMLPDSLTEEQVKKTYRMFPYMLCCGTGTAGTVTYCRSGTGTVF